jgi:hypothetical protein
MWLKKQHYKVQTRFGGQIQAVQFSGILNCRNGLIFTEVLVSKRPKHYVYSRNLTSIILHLLLPVLVAIGNTIKEHIGNIREHKKIILIYLPNTPEFMDMITSSTSNDGERSIESSSSIHSKLDKSW